MKADLKITGMTCASCSSRVTKKLNRLDGVNAVVNLATEQAHVEYPDELDIADLIAAVEKAGYGAQELIPDSPADEDDDDAAAARRQADLWRRFVVAAVLSVPIIALSMIPAWQFSGWQWFVTVLGLPVAFWAGWPFHRDAFAAARHGATNMNTLVSLGVLTAMGWSLWALFFGGAGGSDYTMSMSGVLRLDAQGHHHIYIESAAMIVTFLLLGRWLESRSRRRAGNALKLLLSTGAPQAHRVQRADGTECDETIDARELMVGDVFVVHAGQKIPADGVVLSGSSSVDASLITGESTPVNVGPGAEVIGATLATHGSLRIKATRVGSETTLAQMGRLLEQAQLGQAPMQRIADRISSVFVPAVIGIAIITFIVRAFMLDQTLDTALTSAITVLVVACPCALGLATPTALLVGSGRLSQFGILISGPEALENAHSLSVIAFDKTGTLTTGDLTIGEVSCASATLSENEVLGVLAGIESHSSHPLAQAITNSANERGVKALEVTDVHEEAGRGLRGTWNGQEIFAGNLAWLADNGVPAPETTPDTTMVAVGSTSEFLGYVTLTDTVRPEASSVITWLRENNIEPIMITGDNAASAQGIADELGIKNVHAQVLPGDKLSIIKELQSSGEKVAMVGDGLNDAAALATADLAIAMGLGTDVAQASADVTIMQSRIGIIPTMLRIGQKTLRIIRENLVWAFGYNVIAIPLAVCGIIAPGLAAIAMASSSVIVVVNSLRLRKAS